MRLRLPVPPAKKYAGTTPVFDVRRYFDGELAGEGMLRGWRGKILSRFTFTMKGDWNGNEGTLHEAFTFDSGTKQERTWTIWVRSDNRFFAKASDGVGTGEGWQYGSVGNLRYTLAVSLNGRTWHVAFDDWLFLLEGGVTLNDTTLRKFGFPLARLTAAIRKLPTAK
jgi:Protein of unknown function (DUF3833)